MLKGSIVAIVTPMKQNGDIDFAAFERLVIRQVNAGTQGIVVAGTTGESSTLTEKEKLKLFKLAKEISGQKSVIIASTGSSCTQRTIDFSNEAMQFADFCLVITPMYNKPTQEGLYLHYKQIAKKVLGPIILYNVPSRTGVDLLPETVARLSSLKSIIGIKEAHPDTQRVSKLVKLCGNDILYYCGNDNLNLEFAMQGGDGCISVTANVAPELMNNMYKAFFVKNFAQANFIHSTLSDLHHAMSLETNPIPVKWMLHKMGLIESGIRLPLTTLKPKYHEVIDNVLDKLSLARSPLEC